MRFVIVTGMSGAGKSTVLRFLEDAGFFCVDNLPIPLISSFADYAFADGNQKNVALGIDVRSGEAQFGKLSQIFYYMKEKGYRYETLFLDAEDAVIVRRYKETRRSHPLAKDDRIDTGIQRERGLLAEIKQCSDYIIDTSKLLTRELKKSVENIFVKNQPYHNLFVTVMSFGFKYGIPEDVDLLFDVRFLPNPYYVEGLRAKTGNDEAVRSFVMQATESQTFLEKLSDLLRFLIPNYIREGKNQLVIALGCTGGKHRSVTMANYVYELLSREEGIGVKQFHRDIDLDRITKGV